MTIMCAKVPMPPKTEIINLDLSTIKDEVPTLLVKCTLEIERRSCTTPGIYRMTGVTSRVQKILKSFESGPHLIDVSDVSPNDLCSVLKVFLREVIKYHKSIATQLPRLALMTDPFLLTRLSIRFNWIVISVEATVDNQRCLQRVHRHRPQV